MNEENLPLGNYIVISTILTIITYVNLGFGILLFFMGSLSFLIAATVLQKKQLFQITFGYIKVAIIPYGFFLALWFNLPSSNMCERNDCPTNFEYVTGILENWDINLVNILLPLTVVFILYVSYNIRK